MRLQPTLESANESESLSEILLLQGFDGVSISVTFTNRECPGITPGHLLRLGYGIMNIIFDRIRQIGNLQYTMTMSLSDL